MLGSAHTRHLVRCDANASLVRRLPGMNVWGPDKADPQLEIIIV